MPLFKINIYWNEIKRLLTVDIFKKITRTLTTISIKTKCKISTKTSISTILK